MVKSPIRSVEDLVVYQRLVDLHLEVNSLTMDFPRHELYELGSQLRRSSDAIPATMAGRKSYLKSTILEPLLERYEECGRMLRGLELALLRSDARSRK
jgi:23S rRNA-intervening sequence protein